MKPGFFENAVGEKSSTRIGNMLVKIVILGIWGKLCWDKQELVPFDPWVLGAMGLGEVKAAVDKWTESTAGTEQVKIAKGIIEKIKKK